MEKRIEETSRELSRATRPMSFRDLMAWPWSRRNGNTPVTVEDPFESLQQSMNRLIESFRQDVGLWPTDTTGGGVGSRMDVSETDEAFEVKVELPGLDEKNVELAVTRDSLTIRGEKKSETNEKRREYHYRECTYGRVERVVALPEGVDTNKIVAKFKNGVLNITLPKTPEASKAVRKVPIQA